MTNFENVRQLLAEVKNCPSTQISTYFAPVSDKIRFLPKAEKMECAQFFYDWAKENSEHEPLKFAYAEFLLALTHFTLEEHEEALQLISNARKDFEKLNDED